MSQSFDHRHVQISELESSSPHMHFVKNTPRLQCAISSTSTGAFDSQLLIEHPLSSSTPTMISEDISNVAPFVVDGNQSNMDHITSLERSLCSDFVCCGVRLSDLHALLEHFEEDHVVVLAPNGKRIYPPEGLRSVPLHPITSRETTPASSRSSSAAPATPPPSGPSSSHRLSRPNGAFSNRKSSLSVTPVYTPFTPSLPVDPAYPYSDTTEIVMAHDSDHDFPIQPDFYATVSENVSMESDGSSEDEDMSDGSSAIGVHESPTSLIPTYVFGPDKGQPIAEIPKHVRFLNSSTKGASSSSTKPSKSRRNSGVISSHARRREKAYHCPTPRCTKSYLNPNGLKYHLEKGTCKFEDEEDLSMSDDPGTSLPSAPSPPRSSTAHAEPSSLPIPISSLSSCSVHNHPGLSSTRVSRTDSVDAPATPSPSLPDDSLPCLLPHLHAAQLQHTPGTSHIPSASVTSISKLNKRDTAVALGAYFSAQNPQESATFSNPSTAVSADSNLKDTSEEQRPEQLQYTHPPQQGRHAYGQQHQLPRQEDEEDSEPLVAPPICAPSHQPTSRSILTLSLPLHPLPSQIQTQQQADSIQYHHPVPTYPQGFTAYSHPPGPRAYYSAVAGAAAGLVPSARSQ